MIIRTRTHRWSPTSRLHSLALASLSTVLFAASSVRADGNDDELSMVRQIVGGWYLALDAGPFDPSLAGLFLSGLAHFHADRTFMVSDAGDFGAQSFPEPQATPQYGVWKVRRSPGHPYSRRIEGTTLFLAGDKDTGEALAWQKVQFTLHVVDRKRVEGTVNVFLLPCENLIPIPTPLTCPDPIANADAFMPASPPDVPVTLTRIVVGE